MTKLPLHQIIGDVVMAAILSVASVLLVAAAWYNWRGVLGIYFSGLLLRATYVTAWNMRTGDRLLLSDPKRTAQMIESLVKPFSRWVKLVPFLTVAGVLYYLIVTTFGDGRPFQ